MDSISMRANQKVTVTALPKAPDDQDGVLVAGDVPTWTSNNPSVASVTPAADGLTAEVRTFAINGVAQVDVKAHAVAFGPLFTSSFQVVKTPEQADHFTFQFGVPTAG